jgi:urea transporter
MSNRRNFIRTVASVAVALNSLEKGSRKYSAKKIKKPIVLSTWNLVLKLGCLANFEK